MSSLRSVFLAAATLLKNVSSLAWLFCLRMSVAKRSQRCDPRQERDGLPQSCCQRNLIDASQILTPESQATSSCLIFPRGVCFVFRRMRGLERVFSCQQRRPHGNPFCVICPPKLVKRTSVLCKVSSLSACVPRQLSLPWQGLGKAGGGGETWAAMKCGALAHEGAVLKGTRGGS